MIKRPSRSLICRQLPLGTCMARIYSRRNGPPTSGDGRPIPRLEAVAIGEKIWLSQRYPTSGGRFCATWLPPSALFPHRQRLAPHGFVLPRFVNVDRHHPMAAVALRSTSKNLSESRRSEHNVECQVCGSAENPAAQSRSRNFCIFAGSLSGMRSASDTVEAGNTARQSTTAAYAFSDCPRAA